MIAYWDIIQGTDQWHEIRYGKIGGTLSSSLLVKSHTLLKNVGSCYTEEYVPTPDSFVNYDMQRGIELEPMARRELSVYTGLIFKECGWLQSLKCDLMGISPDGITEDLKHIAEIKCPNKEKHFENCYNNKIPDDNIYQCIQSFAVNPGLISVFFCSFRPENLRPLFVKELKRSDIIELTVNRKKESGTVISFADRLMESALELQVKIKNTVDNLTF